MTKIPKEFVAGLSQSAQTAAEHWWKQLSREDRAAVNALSSTEFDAQSAPKILGGKFLANDEAAGWSEWFAAYFDHLVAHPECLADESVIRTFHIG